MQLLVVDESKKKAWVRSRRVLAAHLFRRGERTFTGRLSAEGLKNLVADLKKVASKNSAITIFKLTAHAEFELVARVGDTSAWGEEGWFAHRQRAGGGSSPAEGYTATERLLRCLIRLSALAHDLGKANLQFQAMLRGENGAQVLRHELVSLLMLRAAISGQDDPFKALASSAFSGFEKLDSSLPEVGQAWNCATDDLLRAEAVDLLQRVSGSDISALWAAVEYLVLTHHRHIGHDQTSGSAKNFVSSRALVPSLNRQLNATLCQGNKVTPENLQLAEEGRPWRDGRWLASVRDNAARVSRLLEDNPSLLGAISNQPALWAKNIALFARPTLILADHLASATKSPCGKQSASLAYANTVGGKLADTLSEHLLKTRFACDSLFKVMSGHNEALPSWRPPSQSILFSEAPAQFRWQNEAVAAVKGVEGLGARPFMALVVSGTGAGKTITAPKLLAAAGEGLRYTCALGLRSLTLQTGAAYRKMLGLGDDECMTVIGDALYAQLAGAGGRDGPPSPAEGSVGALEREGSESLESFEDFMFCTGGAKGRLLAQGLGVGSEQAAAVARDKRSGMVETPVLVCTTDHLMGACELAKGRDTALSLRVATADLVLDEVDNYSLEDLQAVGRLVHQAGCHGRRVVLMSATAGRQVLRGLHAAWVEGLKVWQQRRGRSDDPVLALVSNQVGTEIVEGSGAPEKITSFLDRLCAHSRGAASKTRAAVLRCGMDRASAFQAIWSQCLDFAREHSTVCAKSGGRLSVGFVRFNQVANARRFARFLLDEVQPPNGVSLKVQCYHRRMPLLHLASIEQTLNSMLNRADEQAIFSHPVITRWDSKEPLRLIVVVTTSIQETGRDHDYDFAVAEPWSVRSLVQLAGRVRRHRPALENNCNVALLDKEINLLEDAKPNAHKALEIGHEPLDHRTLISAVTGPPGPAQQPALRQLRRSLDELEKLPPPESRAAWFPPDFFEKGIHAAPCLRPSPADGPLARIDAWAQAHRMFSQDSLSLREICSETPTLGVAPHALWAANTSCVVFRRSDKQAMAQFTLDPDAGFQRLALVGKDPATKRPVTRAKLNAQGRAVVVGTGIVNKGRALVRTDLLTSEQAAEEALGSSARDPVARRLCYSFEAYVTNGSAESTDVDLDLLLGADT